MARLALVAIAIALTTPCALAEISSVQPFGDAHGRFLAVSVTGRAACDGGLCVAASGTGDAASPLVAASLTGSANSGTVAATGIGFARGFLAVSALGDVRGPIAFTVFGDSSSAFLAASGTGHAGPECVNDFCFGPRLGLSGCDTLGACEDPRPLLP